MRKKLSALFLGLIVFIYGLYSVLNNYFSVLPQISIIIQSLPMEILIAIGGFFLFCYSFSVSYGFAKIVSILAGLILFILGAMPLLLEFRWVNQLLPFLPALDISSLVLAFILLFYGLFLIIDSFIMD